MTSLAASSAFTSCRGTNIHPSWHCTVSRPHDPRSSRFAAQAASPCGQMRHQQSLLPKALVPRKLGEYLLIRHQSFKRQLHNCKLLAQSNLFVKLYQPNTHKLAPHMALFPCRLLHNLSAANLLYPLASQLAMPGSQKSPRSLPIKIQAGLRRRGLHRLFGSLGCCRLLAVLEGISRSFQVWMVDGVCPASASRTFSQGSGSKSSALARAATPAASLAASPGAGASQDQLPNGVKDLAHQCQNSLESRLGLLNALASRFWLGPHCAFSCHMLCDLPRCQFCIFVLSRD